MKDRIARVNSLISRELSLILQNVLSEKDLFFSIVAVDTVSDLSEAKVYITCQGKDIAKEIEPRIREIQSRLNHKLVMKFVPKIKFIYED